MTFGFSRDDAGKVLGAYYDKKIYENDPFAKLDQNGVGKLMEMAISKGKASGKNLHYGICGEHGGDPVSVEFCHKIGLDYVSCSPFRVPIARLDTTGVGKLMTMAVKMGKEVRPNMHFGICGEHGGDPASVEFCHRTGLAYVSCSPYRVPIARLAAAQAAIKDGRN